MYILAPNHKHWEDEMEKTVLVSYATKYGATAEIAERICDVLSENGLSAEALPADRVDDVAAYGALILGSAVYIGRWRKEAIRLLEANEAKLAQMPVWLYSSGPTGEGDPVELLKGWKLPGKLEPVADRIGVRDVAVFHGAVDVDNLNFIDLLFAFLGVSTAFGIVMAASNRDALALQQAAARAEARAQGPGEA